MKIAIIGAGISGLTLAAFLRQKAPRLQVAIFEQDPSAHARSVGYSIALKEEAGLGVMTRLGLRDAVTNQHTEPVSRFLVLDQRGQPLLDTYRPTQPDATVYRLQRSYLKSVLLDAIGPTPIYYNWRCVGYQPTEHRVRALFADGTQYEADFLIGSDGVGSLLRQQMLGNQKQFLGLTSIYGTTLGRINHPLLKQSILIILGDAGTTLLAYQQPDGPEVLFSYAFKAPQADFLTTLKPPDWLDHVQRQTANWCPPVSEIVQSTVSDRVGLRPFYDCPPPNRMRHGNVWLIGDAAHPMCPFRGEAANTGMVDAEAVGHLLVQLNNPFALGSGRKATNQVERRLLKQGRAAVLSSRQSARQFHLSTPLLQGWRNLTLRVVNQLIRLSG